MDLFSRLDKAQYHNANLMVSCSTDIGGRRVGWSLVGVWGLCRPLTISAPALRGGGRVVVP